MAVPGLYSDADRARLVDIDKQTHYDESYRSAFRRDYSRLLHSGAFRRLQGKTQLFPSHESDFSRNRLTHSLEVAQVAKSIALLINSREEYFSKNPIDTDLVEFAGLAHDLGHPPFGHNGEDALNEKMTGYGGFEGNAQTLRILTKLEKRYVSGDDFTQEIKKSSGKSHKVDDLRCGLNLTLRSLAAVIKYYDEIDGKSKSVPKVDKGYYGSEADIVSKIVGAVSPSLPSGSAFKTVECQIMDIADDIAYSTYDLEDAFKAGFLSPMKMISAGREIKERVASEVLKRCQKYYPDEKGYWDGFDFGDVEAIIRRVFHGLVDDWGVLIAEEYKTAQEYVFWLSSTLEKISSEWAGNSYVRGSFTSYLVGKSVNQVEVDLDEKLPMLSRVRLNIDAFLDVEVIKIFTYEYIIMSPMLKLAEFRGKEIVAELFDILSSGSGHLMLPKDYRVLYEKAVEIGDEHFSRRVVADFIAGMTDRYAIEFFGRLKASNPPSIHKPY